MFGSAALFLFLSWVQVSSDTYIVKSSAGEERAKHVLKELEDFHQLLGTFAFRNTELPELPIEVLLIGDEATMIELEPEYKGRKLPVAGYYQRGQDRDFVVLSGLVFPETLTSVVYHELTHYFLSRALVSRPTWLNEGFAEYFATAEIRDDEILLGAVSPERMQLLKTSSLLPLKDFFAVDSESPFYNETSKASVFYAEAWAFIHYMLHGEHEAKFREYLEALAKGDADLLQYLNVNEPDLEKGFQNYMKVFIGRPTRKIIKASAEAWNMKVDSIPDTEAQMSIAEIFLANGKVSEARRHLEVLGGKTPDSTRVSYYRGILARMAGDAPAAREFFVDALLDPFLGARAAVQLVNLGELNIPAVRSLLEGAAASGTRNAEVYLALARIYSEGVRQIEETASLRHKGDVPPIPSRVAEDPAAGTEPVLRSYAQGFDHNVRYELLAGTDGRPQLQAFVAPYYPADLLEQKISGEVIVDLQVTEEGKVGGVWLVSSLPDVFGSLATASVRQWQFEPVSAKIRVVLEFKP
jgi:TonB family protein